MWTYVRIQACTLLHVSIQRTYCTCSLRYDTCTYVYDLPNNLKAHMLARGGHSESDYSHMTGVWPGTVMLPLPFPVKGPWHWGIHNTQEMYTLLMNKAYHKDFKHCAVKEWHGPQIIQRVRTLSRLWNISSCIFSTVHLSAAVLDHQEKVTLGHI